MSQLFSPLTLRSTTFRNRIFVSPMCQYSSVDGLANDWHLVHLGSRAAGGAALVMVEASAVDPVGRISPDDSGIWSDAHAEAFRPITAFIKSQGAVPAIQIAHAGRKASTQVPWLAGSGLADDERGWEPIGPSPIAFAEGYRVPHEMTIAEIESVAAQFVAAAERARTAGFEVVEIHAAHGYLLHEFLSPLSNHRNDEYGGSLENRMRFPLRVVDAVRKVWPAELPLFIRISATDWTEGGWDLEQSLVLATKLKSLGVDLIDCSSGGNVAKARIPLGPGYQVAFSREIRKHAGIATGAVGLITKAQQAEGIVANGEADAVLLARQLLRDPYWPLHAARELDVEVDWPKQYLRARP
ncbi:MAG: NADH:flavin oxidoreductase/NADH oxidase [Thermoanaerobaculia bacterium]